MPAFSLYRFPCGFAATLLLCSGLVACGPSYSPDTYSSNAVQQASKVDAGVIIGVRKVEIKRSSSVATATGGAAGGIAGSQAADGAVGALTALGGAVTGGLVGSAVGHKVEDTFGYEYIVRKPNGDLVSVTQKDATPLKLGERVLVIQGSEARIVADYTVPLEPEKDDLADRHKQAGSGKSDPASIVREPVVIVPVSPHSAQPAPEKVQGDVPAASATVGESATSAPVAEEVAKAQDAPKDQNAQPNAETKPDNAPESKTPESSAEESKTEPHKSGTETPTSVPANSI